MKAMTPTRKRVFYNLESFIRFYSTHKDEISSLRIKPIKLGSDNFGAIKVSLKNRFSSHA